MRQPYRLLTAGLALCAAAAVVGALFLLHRSRTVDMGAEVGKWLLTVAAALVLTGALSMVVKQIDERRSEREAWHGILNDLVAANQKVALARIRLDAHRSAKTYREQMAEVMDARVELRRIAALDFVTRDKSLREQVTAMREYVDALGREYEAGYLRVARQQRLDEAWLDQRIKEASVATGAPELPQLLAEPTVAWMLLTDATRFPRLGALLDDDAFRIDIFRIRYKFAKDSLEVHAGFGHPSSESLAYRAQKLATRAAEFADLHAARLGDLKELIDKMVQRVDDAGDRDAIQKAAVELSDLTARAVSLVYPMAKRDGAGGDAPAVLTAGTDADATGRPLPPQSVATEV